MTVPGNTLVAPRQDSTQLYSGISLVEGIMDIRHGIESESWVETTIGGVGVGLDGLSLVFDPLGTVASWGIADMIEHVKPLSDALDWLAGDPDQITANAQTWANVAGQTKQTATELREAIWQDVPAWHGPAAEAYRNRAAWQITALDGLSEAAGGISSAVSLSGMLVSLVRQLVRDLIADFVSVLAFRIPEWIAELGFTIGIATPWVLAQVSTLAARWGKRISTLLINLIDSLRRLGHKVTELDGAVASLRGKLGDSTGGPHGGGAETDLGSGGPSNRAPDVDGDGRPDALDADRDGDGTLDDLNGDGHPDIPPPITDGPPMPTRDLDPAYAGETDPEIAERIFNVPSNGVRYLTPEELEAHRLFVRDGQIYSVRDAQLFDTSGSYTLHSTGESAIFVMDHHGNLYATTEHILAEFHHSSFLAGQPVAGAGDMVIRDGKLISITDRSGHYKPSPDFLDRVLENLERQGIDTSQVRKGSWP